MAELQSLQIDESSSFAFPTASNTTDVGYIWFNESSSVFEYSGWENENIVAKVLGNSTATTSGSAPAPSIPTGLSDAIYSQNVSSTTTWSSNTHTLSSDYNGSTVRVVWEYNNGTSYRGDFQLDDFTLFGTTYSPEAGIVSGWQTSTVNTAAYTSVSWSALGNGTNTNRWNRDASGTPSSSTGLTSGNTGIYYYYAETSGTSGQKYWLRSPEITISGNYNITYYKAHYGSNVGDYKVYVDVIS